MAVTVRLLGPTDGAVLDRVADGVFDLPVQEALAQEFLSDGRHHMMVALDDGMVVGMISAVHYVHPDKPTQLWINEVGVAPSRHREGIGRRLLDAMLAHARTLGCTEAWLGTEENNVAARGLYESVGAIPESFLLYEFPLFPPTPL
jgi:ribosomal protein S18 acetylase RimI-like enzyme